MTKSALQRMAVDELVQQFAALALEQDDALLGNDIAQVNRLFRKLEDVEDELKARPGDQRQALLVLYHHSNPQVQVKAAKATLAVAPAAARQVLEIVSDTCNGPQRLEAGMCLWNLDRGFFKPT